MAGGSDTGAAHDLIPLLRQATMELADEAADFCSELVRTPSLPGSEEECARLVLQRMQRLGYDEAFIDGMGNAVGLIRGAVSERPRLMLNAHIDHVEPGDEAAWDHPPYSGLIRDGFVWGRGASDTKSSVAVQVYSWAVLRRAGLRPPGDVVVAAVVLEEVGGLGTRHLMDLGPRPDLVVLGEATSNAISLGHRGRTEFVAEVQGRSSHASAPERGANPHIPLARFQLGLAEIVSRLPEHPALGPSTLVPTVYETSSASRNMIPERCRLFLDFRTGGDDVSPVLHALRELMQEVCTTGSEDTSGSVAVSEEAVESYTGVMSRYLNELRAIWIEEDHPFVRAARGTLQAALGRPVSLVRWGFCTDGAHTAGVHSIPTIGFSPGEERYTHSCNERVDIRLMAEALLGYASFLATDWRGHVCQGLCG
ncbi:MAG: M20/M25/M40 family metallo-hydrolase [Firmicutes bacterium]|nr:M20/M25/M40 family metallo-hydrolase [Bacillota bacterium]